MQSPPVLSIPMLSATNYADWFVACTTAAKKCLPTNGALGGLGFILSTEEYTALNNGESFTPAEKPEVVTKTETCHLQSVYDREQIALASLTAAIFDSIPAATKQAWTGYHIRFGSSFIPLPTMQSLKKIPEGTSPTEPLKIYLLNLPLTLSQPSLPVMALQHASARLLHESLPTWVATVPPPPVDTMVLLLLQPTPHLNYGMRSSVPFRKSFHPCWQLPLRVHHRLLVQPLRLCSQAMIVHMMCHPQVLTVIYTAGLMAWAATPPSTV